MIKHFPPFVTERTTLKPDELAFHTRNVTAGDGEFLPSQRITGHYDALVASLHGKVNNTYFGRMFEICWWEALVKYGVQPSAIEHHVDLSKGLHAEADLLVHVDGERIPLLLKTSLRERWKQIDRDALVMRNGDLGQAYAIFYREKPADTIERMIAHARKTQRMFYSQACLLTVLDEVAVQALFRRLGAG